MKIGYLMQAGVPNVREHPFYGPSVHVRQVFAELDKLGHHVRLLANLEGRRIWKSDNLVDFELVSMPYLDTGPIRLIERAVRRFQYQLQLPYIALFDSLRFAYACRKELDGYDLFCERMGWMGYGGGLAARWLGIPLVLEVNGDYLPELEMRGMSPHGLQRMLSVVLTKKTVRLASHVVATGEGLRKSLVDHWEVDPGKVSVVENGSELVGLLERGQLRSFLPHSAAAGVTSIAFLGTFDPWQGVPILIRAVARGIARGVSLRLLFIGSGPGVEAAEQLAHELQIDECVTFAGQLAPHQYATCLADADIGVSPYCGRTEYLGLKLFDYKAAGLAIIASGENGQPKIIENGRTGWIVPPCDEDALYEAIVQLSSDVELRKRMGREARIEAEQFHGWNRTAQRLNDLFNQVMRDYHGDGIKTTQRDSLQPT